jgi:hypothetical protein
LVDVKNVFAHYIDFNGGVNEVSTTRADENVNGKAAAFDGSADQTVARREAAFAQARTEFDAARPAFTCYKAGLDGFGTEFKYYLAHSIARNPKKSKVARMLVEVRNIRLQMADGSGNFKAGDEDQPLPVVDAG